MYGSYAIIGVTISRTFGHRGRVIVGILLILVFSMYIVKAIKDRNKTNLLIMVFAGIPASIMGIGIILENLTLGGIGFIGLCINAIIVKKLGVKYRE